MRFGLVARRDGMGGAGLGSMRGCGFGVAIATPKPHPWVAGRWNTLSFWMMGGLAAVSGFLRLGGWVGSVAPGTGGADDLGLCELDDEVPGQADRGPDDEHVRQGLE